MKNIGLYLLAIIASAGTLSAAPLVSIGEKVDVYFNASLSEAYNTNIYSNHSNEVDDFITTLEVGLTAEYGRDTTFNGNIGFIESFVWYASETQLNDDLFSAFFNTNYNGDRYSSKLNFTYAQKQENTSSMNRDLRTLVRYDTVNLYWRNYYDLTAKINLDLNFYYAGTYYDDQWTNSYSDSDVFTIPFDIMYAVTDKYRLGIATQYRKSIFHGGSTAYDYYGKDRDDFFLGLTINGQFTSKLSGKIYFGGTYRVYNGADEAVDNELTMAMSAALNYKITDKLSSSLNFSRDFGNGASRQSILETSVDLSFAYAVTEKISMSAAFSYTNEEYQYYANDRVDDEFYPTLGVSYSLNRYVSMSFSYSYLFNASNIDTNEYDRHYLAATLSVRY